MSLRDEAITHMAQAVHSFHGESWVCDDKPQATAALDALLSYLTAHTEEWAAEAFTKRRPEQSAWADALVAALRGTTEEQ